MADERISELPLVSTPLSGTEVLPVVQSGNTLQASIQNVSDYVKPYKVYTALLTQSGTDAPIENYVFENTIGEMSFTRTSIGNYTIFCENVFTIGKTFVTITNFTGNSTTTFADGNIDSSYIFIYNGIGTYIDGDPPVYNFYHLDTDGGTCCIEIRVYN